jgi:3-hydroxyacyl-CoA dehydrogenase
MLQPLESNTSRTSAALEHVRCLVAMCRKSAEEVVQSAPATPVRSVGIVGAGIMGAAIAREHAMRGLSVVVCDSDPEALRRAARHCGTTNGTGSVFFTLSLADLEGCDLVLESIAERRPAKQTLYKQLSPHLIAGGIFATNTSTIPITRLAFGHAAPSRFAGLHFCHPVRLRPLVEIIPGAATSRDTISSLTAHALLLGKLPLIVGDGPGFVVNRLLMAYLNASLDTLVGGMPPSEIDAAMTRFGMTMGPLTLLDEIGLDTALQSGMVLSEVNEERSAGTELLVRLVKSQQIGVKSGAGIYKYPEKHSNPALAAFVKAECRGNDAIVARLLQPMVREATRLLDENKVVDTWQIDLATNFGLGFPCWRGGLLWWAENGTTAVP